jgi:hypothetical protein
MDDAANEIPSLTPAEGAEGSAEGGNPPTHTVDPAAASSRISPKRSRKAKRRKVKRARATRPAPAEGAARDAAAAEALAAFGEGQAAGDYVAAPPPEGAPEDAPGQVPEVPEYPPERAAEDLAAVIRLAARGIGLVLKRKGFTQAGASLYEGAEAYAAMASASLGERAGARFGGKLAIAGIVAALAEPLLADLWAKAGENTGK